MLANRILRVQLKEKVNDILHNSEILILALFPLLCGILAHFLYPNNPAFVGIGCLIGLVIGMVWMGMQEIMTEC